MFLQRVFLQRVAMSLLAVLIPVAAGEAATELRPVVVLSGSGSGVGNAECLRVTSQAEWEPIWKRHAARQGKLEHGLEAQQTPVVDFTNCMVIAVFGGSTWNTDGLKVLSASDNGDEIVIRMNWLTYQTPEKGDKATPFAFIVMPRSPKPFVLQVNARSKTERAEGLAPKWKDYHRFAGLTK